MGRAPCCSKVGLHRGPWTAKEDALLIKYIEAHGEGQWRSLPKKAGLLRCGKSCRLRWMNYLRPDIKRGNITLDEEDLIIRLHGLLGNRWSLIAGRLPGRTDNEIKNYWNTHLSKKLRSQGTDPNTHKKLPESELQRSSSHNTSKKRGRTTNYGTIKEKSNKKEKKEENNIGNEERTKIHLPKPIRVSSTIPLTLIRSNSNGSFDTNNMCTTGVTSSQSQSESQCRITFGLDTDNVMVEDMPWLSTSNGHHTNIMCHDHDDDGHGLRHLMMMDVIKPRDGHQDDVAPPGDATQFERLYEEYLQLIKADNHDRDHGGYHGDDVNDDHDDEDARLNSLTASFLI